MVTPDPVPMSSADLDESDIEAVAAVLRSGRLALGPRAEEFERRIAEYVGTGYAVAVSSGTAALHLIVRALKLGPGDEVLVPSFTFAASANAILYEGATPVFVDVDPETYTLDPRDLERKITARTQAIMVVDVFGHPAEWDAVLEIAARHSLKVIDDSCEALGADYRGKKLGQFGDAAAFAFYPNKQMTTGEGGMIVTDDENLAAACRSLRNQGRGRMGSWLEHEQLGYNYRLNEMSAALGVSQFRRLEDFLARRERVADAYGGLLADFEPVRRPIPKPHVRMAWFVYVVTLEDGIDRTRLIRTLAARGIPTRTYFPPLHRQVYLREWVGQSDPRLPVTEAYAGRTLALPFHNNLSAEQIERVVDELKRAI